MFVKKCKASNKVLLNIGVHKICGLCLCNTYIPNEVLKGEEKILLQNKHSNMVAGLSKKHLNKIISTVFTKDTEGKYGYLKKEIISNVDAIFFAAVPILKHPELKKTMLYDCQIIHRLALQIGRASCRERV